jgi:predicted naringenin-chalcone synthase
MGLSILGLATALPEGVVHQQQAAAEAMPYCTSTAAQRRRLSRLYESTTVDTRRTVLGGQTHDPNGQAGSRPPAPRDGSAAPAPTGLLSDTFYPPPNDDADRGPTVSQRMAVYRTHALPLVQQAAQEALEQARLTPSEVGQLIVVSCTGFSSPGLDVQLIDALGLPDETGRTIVGFMGCHGALNGLRVAQGLAQAPGGVVLMCCVELCSLHFQYGWDPDQVLANALFADGAAALVAQNGEASEARATISPVDQAAVQGKVNGDRHGDGLAHWQVIDSRCKLLPDSREDMQWHIAEHGFEMVLSKRVPSLIEQHLQPWLAQWLSEHGLNVEQIAHWAIHPGGPRVIGSVEQALQLREGAGDTSRAVLQAYGNMSSPTVLFILDRLRQAKASGWCLALGFGPGLIVEAALLQAR